MTEINYRSLLKRAMSGVHRKRNGEPWPWFTEQEAVLLDALDKEQRADIAADVDGYYTQVKDA